MYNIECIAIDIDGVLTDGKLNIDHTGEKLFKSFHTRDVRAIRQLVSMGIEVYLVTADDWNGGKEFAEKVGAEFLYLRDKSQFISHVNNRAFIAIGDDVWDVRLLCSAQIAFCPCDADFSVRKIEGIKVLSAKGGNGCIAELLNRLPDMKKKADENNLHHTIS